MDGADLPAARLRFVCGAIGGRSCLQGCRPAAARLQWDPTTGMQGSSLKTCRRHLDPRAPCECPQGHREINPDHKETPSQCATQKHHRSTVSKHDTEAPPQSAPPQTAPGSQHQTVSTMRSAPLQTAPGGQHQTITSMQSAPPQSAPGGQVYGQHLEHQFARPC